MSGDGSGEMHGMEGWFHEPSAGHTDAAERVVSKQKLVAVLRKRPKSHARYGAARDGSATDRGRVAIHYALTDTSAPCWRRCARKASDDCDVEST
jgi:hypothetical protein